MTGNETGYLISNALASILLMIIFTACQVNWVRWCPDIIIIIIITSCEDIMYYVHVCIFTWRNHWLVIND